MIQVKKQLTAGPHLLVVNNQGKPFLKQYKMSPQADALSIRIMRFFAPLKMRTYFIAFVSPKSVFMVHIQIFLPFRSMPYLK